MADLKSLCHICGKIADANCKMCGRPACSLHLDKKTGVCRSCAAGRR